MLLPTLVETDPPEARQRRDALVSTIAAENRLSPRVVEVMRRVPRQWFTPTGSLDRVYEDEPLPIGQGQTISQPTIVAVMTDALDLHGSERVLEIGTGSGYQAAILSELAAHVYSIEVVPVLAERAERTLRERGFANVTVRCGDGYAGWPEEAPFDRIVLTAAPPTLPETLVAQLADGGVLVAPIGDDYDQWLVRLTKHGKEVRREMLDPVRFVPMVPARGW